MPRKKNKKNKKKGKTSTEPETEKTEEISNEVKAPEGTVVEKTTAVITEKQKLENALYYGRVPAGTSTGNDVADHEFWNSQPVPKMDQEIDKTGPIEEKKLSDVKKQPYALPAGFEWYPMDLNDPKDLKNMYDLLSSHYVEDDENMFRFNYSEPFLQWALMPPGFLREWHLAVRVKKSGKLVACITGIPAKIRVHEDVVDMVEINFLCVHKKLRSKRLAPVLIKEITRRVNLQDIWQAAYTAGVVIPKPVARNQYWHRSFDPEKLVDIRFSSIPRNSTLRVMKRLAKVPEEFTHTGFRPMQEKDVPEVTELLSNYLKTFKYTPIFNEEEVRHWFLPRKGVVAAFVREVDGKVTDMFSYYCLSSHVIGHPKYHSLNAVYSYYNVAGSLDWTELMRNALIAARKLDDKDVFNCLNVMENQDFLKPLKFGPGDGYLHYYLYNWLSPAMEPSDVGLVLM